MHDTRTRHCLGKLLSISGVNQGKGARSRPRTMGAWVSNTSSNDTGAPPIQAYKCERSCLRVYYHAYILTSLSFRPFLFPAFSPSFVPFFIGKDTTVHGRDQGICLAKKASYKGFRNPIGILSFSLLKLPDRWSVCCSNISFLLIVSSKNRGVVECWQNKLYRKNVQLILYIQSSFLILDNGRFSSN